MSDFILQASVRNDLGKGASRRLRRANQQVPAVVYGGEKGAQSISVEKTAFYKAIEDEAFFSSVIKLVIDGKEEQVVVRDLQRHPFKPLLTHADFLRVDAKHEMTMTVPLHFIGEEKAAGVKAGGVVSHVMTEVEIACLPADLPEFIEVDISKLELDHAIHLSELVLPKGVSLPALSHGQEEHLEEGERSAYDQAVVNIHMPRVHSVDDEAEDAEGDEEATEE